MNMANYPGRSSMTCKPLLVNLMVYERLSVEEDRSYKSAIKHW